MYLTNFHLKQGQPMAALAPNRNAIRSIPASFVFGEPNAEQFSKFIGSIGSLSYAMGPVLRDGSESRAVGISCRISNGSTSFGFE
jgi:hypothetical protein